MSIFFSLLPFKLFQFPTGWNSTQEKARSRYFKFMVSIPNGMEFYASGSDYVRFDNVSIPNGMEFYTSILSFGLPSMAGFNSQRDGILPAGLENNTTVENCFNSQRDGILPRVKFPPNFGPRVSIPNGMEFYIFSYGDASPLSSSFNSQRDGILPVGRLVIHPSMTVSIPNGMEFY